MGGVGGVVGCSGRERWVEQSVNIFHERREFCKSDVQGHEAIGALVEWNRSAAWFARDTQRW